MVYVDRMWTPPVNGEITPQTVFCLLQYLMGLLNFRQDPCAPAAFVMSPSH